MTIDFAEFFGQSPNARARGKANNALEDHKARMENRFEGCLYAALALGALGGATHGATGIYTALGSVLFAFYVLWRMSQEQLVVAVKEIVRVRDKEETERAS